MSVERFETEAERAKGLNGLWVAGTWLDGEICDLQRFAATERKAFGAYKPDDALQATIKLRMEAAQAAKNALWVYLALERRDAKADGEAIGIAGGNIVSVMPCDGSGIGEVPIEEWDAAVEELKRDHGRYPTGAAVVKHILAKRDKSA
jgi:hypothetical protein